MYVYCLTAQCWVEDIRRVTFALFLNMKIFNITINYDMNCKVFALIVKR